MGNLVGVLPGLDPLLRFQSSAGHHYALLCSIIMPQEFITEPNTLALLLHPGEYPGEVTSVVTCLDGYQWQAGRAGPALGIAAFGSLLQEPLPSLA